MIYMLLNNEILSASELAEKYGVSQRTIYRDIEAICAAGIPVVSYQGVNGGYRIMEEYKMDRSLLGSYDVGSLVSVLQSMSTVFQDERAAETIRRLQTIQGSGGGSSVSLNVGSRPFYRKSLQLLRNSISESRLVQFGYINAKNERVDRSVEPVQLHYKFDTWYLYGFCRIRSDYREFRLSRMTDLKATGQHFQNKHKLQEETERSAPALQERVLHTVVLHISATSLARALDQFHLAEREFHEDGSLTLRMEMDERSMKTWLLHVVLSFGEDATIIEPPEMRELLVTKLQIMMNQYEG